MAPVSIIDIINFTVVDGWDGADLNWFISYTAG